MKVALFRRQIIGLGGAERVILEYMKRSKHDVKLFTYRVEKDALRWFSSEDKIIKIVQTKKMRLFDKLYPLMIKLPLDDVDAFVASIGEALGEAVVVRNRFTPTIGYFNSILKFADFLEKQYGLPGNTLAKIYGVIFSQIFDSYSELVTNSNFVKESLLKWIRLKRNPDRVRVINPGVDTNTFKPVDVYNDYFLVVSRIDPLKRLELAIYAFSIFKSLCNRRFRLIIAGYLDPRYQIYLDYLAKMCKSDVELVINPRDKDLIKLYQECYALIFTSFNEPFGLVPLEAMSCGKPVIATGEGGFRDYIVTNRNGILSDSSPFGIAKKMLSLAGDYELTRRMGQQARKTALMFDWTRFAERMDYLVECAVSEST